MSKLQLKIHRMETGEHQVAEFDSVADATTWLAQRPPFVEVVRVVTEVDLATETQLREAMRPLDAQEREFIAKADFLREVERKEELSRMQAEAIARDGDGGMPALDPAREMGLRWERGQGLMKSDEQDTREISEAARRVVLHWLRERDGWMHERRQHLAAATFTVWPGSVPSGSESDRIVEADFSAMPGLSDLEIA
jgi:hypothetical protein